MSRVKTKNDVDNGNAASVASSRELLTMTSEMAAAYLTNNHVDSAEVPVVIERIFHKLKALNSARPVMSPAGVADIELPSGAFGGAFGQASEYGMLQQRPAVPIAESVQPDYIICLEDGERLKMLKRHLRTAYNLTPEQYRAKWGLPVDYPMVAPNYAKLRSNHAKRIGLGKQQVPRASLLD